MDRASSSHPAVQAQLDRLALLSPGRDVLGLERISALLGRLGHPERALPPVFHVAGTNGKGSACAFLRAAIEAAGLTAHVYTSPHLVRFNERIRLAGRLIEDEPLAACRGSARRGGEMGSASSKRRRRRPSSTFSRTPATPRRRGRFGRPARRDQRHRRADRHRRRPDRPGPPAFLGDRIEQIAARKRHRQERRTARHPALSDTVDEQVARERSSGRRALAAARRQMGRRGAWRQDHYGDKWGEIEMAMRACRAAQAMKRRSPWRCCASDASRCPRSGLKAAMGWAEWPARRRAGARALARAPARGRRALGRRCHNPAAARAVRFFAPGPGRPPFQSSSGCSPARTHAGVLRRSAPSADPHATGRRPRAPFARPARAAAAREGGSASRRPTSSMRWAGLRGTPTASGRRSC